MSILKGKEMSVKMAVLLIGCVLLGGMISSARAAQIESTELSPDEANAFAQAQAASAQTIEAAAGGDVGSSLLGGFAIIGVIVVALIIVAAAQ